MDLLVLVECIRQTFNPQTSKQAEQSLNQLQENKGFLLTVLSLLRSNEYDIHTRLAGALLFKNIVKKDWHEADKIDPSERSAIKDQIVDIMIAVPPKIQIQLSESVSVIADCDFPKQWESLIQQLVMKLSPQDFNVNNGILQTAHSIFKRWRHQFRSDDLFREIRDVIQQFAEPFLNLMKATDALIQQSGSDKAALELLFQSLLLQGKIFFSFNSQDLPEFFEDHQDEFMSIFHKYLEYQNPLLSDDDESNSLEKLKSTICEIIDLYTQRYEDAFPKLPQFVSTIWEVLTTTSSETKHDMLVSHAIAFLTSVVKQPRHQTIFASPETLSNICERVVVPNLTLRDSDIETFEDDPIEFIRRDLEGSDSDTRRRSASDFVKALLKSFPTEVTTMNLSYIDKYLQLYQADTSKWKEKDTAIALFISIASDSQVITQAGVTSTRLNVVEFFSKHVMSDLENTNNSSVIPILQVDAIKYLCNFRNQLSKDQLLQVFPLLLQHLSSPNHVVYTYSAICIDKVLSMKGKGKTPMFNPADIQPYAENLLINLFKLLQTNMSPEKLAENDYLMKAVLRIILTARSDILPFASPIATELNKFVEITCKNPSNPRFTHYLFESIASLVRLVPSY